MSCRVQVTGEQSALADAEPPDVVRRSINCQVSVLRDPPRGTCPNVSWEKENEAVLQDELYCT